MKTLFLILSLLSFNLYASNCDVEFKETHVCAHYEWVYGPTMNEMNALRVSVSDHSQFDELKVIPWMVMQNHEHGSRPVMTTKLNDLEYSVEKIYFMGGMVGTWYLRFILMKDGSSLEESRVEVFF